MPRGEPKRARRKYTARELGERFGRSPRTIRRVIAEERGEWLARAQKRQDRIRELRATGMTMQAIASKLGCSIGTVHRALKKQPHTPLPETQNEEVAR